jgi:hypothetical protein
MDKYRMKYFPFNLLMVMLFACTSPYKNLRPVAPDLLCMEKVKPKGIATTWFTVAIDVAGKHLSGLLLIKAMPDSSYRVVFTNESGLTFFDFEYGAENTFVVKKIIKQLDKKVIIETLRKDFAAVLGLPFISLKKIEKNVAE